VRTFAKQPRPAWMTAVAAEGPLTGKEQARAVFDSLDKPKLRLIAVAEQRGLCAFCMGRIRADGDGASAIRLAHRVPISTDPTLALTWTNLVASCSSPHSCDERQGSHCLTVDPVLPATTVDQLRYERRAGKEGLWLVSDDPVLANDLEKLGLNDGDLPRLREEAWKAFQVRARARHPKGNAEGRKKLLAAETKDMPLRPYFGVLQAKA